MNEQINVMAQAAGFEGSDGSKFATGQVAFDDDAYVAVFEFLKSLQTDKLVFSGSSSLDDQTARVRWAAGVAGYYLDGPWCSRTVQTEIPAFLPKVNAGPMLTPDESHPLVANAGRKGGNHFISSGSPTGSVLHAARRAGQARIQRRNRRCDGPAALRPRRGAELQGRPDLARPGGLVRRDGLHRPTGIAEEPCGVGGEPTLPAGEAGLGELMQGVSSGDVTDIGKELKKLTDAAAANREQRSPRPRRRCRGGADAYAFSNWKPRTDFTSADYKTS